MNVQWRKGFRRLVFVLSALWVVFFAGLYLWGQSNGAGEITAPLRFWGFFFGPVVALWAAYFFGLWIAAGFRPRHSGP